MGFKLKPIDVVDDITKEDFVKNYLEPRKPLVIRNMAKKWPGFEKWTFEYLKEVVGDKTVPLYDSSKADPSKPLNSSAAEMKFADYIDLIRREPTDLRIFFFDPIKSAPELVNDFIAPKDLMGGFLDKFPGMFFGGEGSETFLHYDIDLPHIFHTHFHGRKHVILFDYKWKERLYCLPFATYALEDYKVEHPDFKKFPALDGIEGMEIILEHGDTLFMPTGMWHWMKYLDGSFSISLRAWDKSWLTKANSLYNLTIQRKFDDLMKKKFSTKYMSWKEKIAVKRAEKALANGEPR
ncbi:cupin-like domain-containing protein [Pedobacter sp. HMF7647]|uniref:Cupin-like domain-containing protein n=1 Tax=Hufsiella arboris TaxID=2695275 RepID=A0A7K1Y496_9SPHI|nr:cupin-like domain-containing protein [Hufsiella arboris]MXV49374.1 cupin-like domain-containing protein [Hufsiella arboris]